MEQSEWKTGLKKLLSLFKSEVKKTTLIGHKMIHASHTNSCLKETYEKLGKLMFEAMENNKLSFESDEAKELFNKINECKNNLASLEADVNKIKFQDGSDLR